MSSAPEEKIIELKEKVNKLQSQKDTLLKELSEIEERFDHMSRLYRKYLPVMIDSMIKGDDAFSKTCRDLSGALKKDEAPGKVEYIFERMKTAMLKEDIGPVQEVKKRGLFNSLLKSSSSSFITDYKHSYHDVINSLRSTLDQRYHTKLDAILSLINTAEDTGDISEIRESVFSLIFVYISETNQDREKVNAFVREVVGKILDIESRLSVSYQQTDDMVESTREFESALSSEVNDLRQNLDVVSSLEDLKMQVSRHLAAIEAALEQKQARDKAIRDMAKKNRHAFKTGFTQLKQELAEATQYSEELEKKLNQDQLTGAFNRRAYDKRIEEEMERFLRYHSTFSLMVIDADKFKQINDNYGHAIGDRCLKEIIKRAIPLLRKNDMLARYGGEEFAVIMPETGIDGACEAAEKIRQTIEKIEFIYKKEKVRVTVSIGVTEVKEGDRHSRQVFERADIAVYKAKENGRNQVMRG